MSEIRMGQRVKILRDGRESEYFTGREGEVLYVERGTAVVGVTLKSGRLVKWIGSVADLEVKDEEGM